MKPSLSLTLAGILCVMLIAAGCTGTPNANTAQPAATTAAPVTTTEAAVATATTSPAVSWSGTWNTTWLERDGNRTVSVMTFKQAATDVTGNYSYTYPDVGTFTGTFNATVQDNTLTGTYAESDDDVGLFVFVLSQDGNAFTGRWVHAPSNMSALHNSTLFWNGVRK